MKEKFMQNYELIRMSKNSLVFRNKSTNESVFIHRNVFNNLDTAVDYRQVTLEDKANIWIEILTWNRF